MTKTTTSEVKEGKSRNRGVLLLLIVSGLFVLYLIIFSFIPAIMLKLVKIDFVVPFEVNQGEQIHCVLIKSETLLEAPVGGTLTLSQAEGSRVKPGQEVGKVTNAQGAEQVLRAPHSGLVCSDIDQLESVLRMDNLDNLKMDQLAKVEKEESAQDEEEEVVQKAAPILKIVDNLAPLVVYFTASSPMALQLKAEDKVTLVWRQNNQTETSDTEEEIHLVGRVVRVNQEKEKSELMVQVNTYPDALVLCRKVDALLLQERLSGFRIHESSLVEEEGKKGIYVVRRGRVVFAPVEVKGTVEGDLVITGESLDVDTRYIENPRWVQVGEKVE